MSTLVDAVAAIVGTLGTTHVGALANTYRSAGPYTPDAATHARQAVPGPHRDEVDQLNRAWSADPGGTGESLALALESAQAAGRLGDAPRIDVVVTGPDSPATPVRLISEVVSQLIGQAAKQVTLVSYAAYWIPSVVAALDAAAARGVHVRLILESREQLDGGGGAGAYARFPTYHWPPDRREPPDAKLHAKAVIVDSRDVPLTSANMTTAAYDRNIELGILCRGGGVADQIQRHFDGLIARGTSGQRPCASS